MYQANLSFTSERLIYRGLDEEDKKLEFEAQSDYYTQMMGNFPPPKPPTKKAIEGFSSWADTCILFVVICLPDEQDPKKPGTAIGYQALNADNPRRAHYKGSELSIQLFPSYRGKGYGTEALSWLLDYAFYGYGLHRVALGTWGYNHMAHKLYRKIGFREEGRAVKSMYYNREWHDELSMAMLEDEWFAKRDKQAA